MATGSRAPLAAAPLHPMDLPVVGPRIGFPFRLLLILTLLPLLLAATALAVYRQQLTDRIYPGVHVFDVDVGRLSRDEAVEAIKSYVVARSRASYVLRHDEGGATVSLASLGLKIDDGELAQFAERALGVGREPELRLWLRSQLDLLRTGYTVPAALTVDRERAASVIRRVAADVERPTVNAGLTVEQAGESYEIHTTPAQTGRRVNVNATLDRLEKGLVNNLGDSTDLVLDEALPAISDADLAPATETIRTILGSPLEFKDGARTWKLEPPAAFAMLEIAGLDQGTPPISAGLNAAKLREFVERTARAADQPARNPVFEVAGDQIVVRPGVVGKLADAEATFAVAWERSVSPIRTLDIIFKEDPPWLTPANLEPARVQANALLDLAITLEAPPPAGAAADGAATANRRWVLDRALLVQMLVLPNTQAAPRDYQTLPAEARPRFEIALDSGRVTNYLAREVAPWVSEDPVDAAIELRTSRVEVPNPAYAEAVAAEQRRAAAAPGSPAVPITIPPTLPETRHRVELRNARDGRGPDYLGTFAAVQVLFRSGQPADPAERRVTVRLAPRPPRVQDRELAPARDTANLLIGEPVTVRWNSAAWTVSRDELAGMLRYQQGGNGLTAYLTRDGLLAKAGAIAREAERLSNAPTDSTGRPLPVDVPNTAAAIWQQASTVAGNRSATIVWTEPEEPPAEPAALPDAG